MKILHEPITTPPGTYPDEQIHLLKRALEVWYCNGLPTKPTPGTYEYGRPT